MSAGKTRTKDKYRVVYNENQRITLENEFKVSEYITVDRKKHISTELGLTERQIKIWFQNRRAKKRKQHKRDISKSVLHPTQPVANHLRHPISTNNININTNTNTNNNNTININNNNINNTHRHQTLNMTPQATTITVPPANVTPTTISSPISVKQEPLQLQPSFRSQVVTPVSNGLQSTPPNMHINNTGVNAHNMNQFSHHIHHQEHMEHHHHSIHQNSVDNYNSYNSYANQYTHSHHHHHHSLNNHPHHHHHSLIQHQYSNQYNY